MSVNLVSVSSKGQIVLPAEMRKTLSISEGDKLAVHMADGVIMLKPVKAPAEEDFLRWMDEAKEWAASVGYEESDVQAAIQSVRGRKRA